MLTYLGNERVRIHLNSSSVNANVLPDFIVGQFVLDFGLPIELEIDEQYPISSVQPITTFGTAVLSEDNIITYTPTAILLSYDTIYAETALGKRVEIRAYPANNIFYDASFLTVDDSALKDGQDRWIYLGEPDSGSQQKCSAKDVYGFDYHYEHESVGNRRWYASSSVPNNSNSRLTCTFIGDGLSIISVSNCVAAKDYVRITNAVTSSAGVTKNKVYYASGYAPEFDDNNVIGLLLCATDLNFGEHALSIYPNTAVASQNQTDMLSQICGICVYNTLKAEPTHYSEHGAKFYDKSTMISNSSWDEETCSGMGFICCDNSDSSGLTITAPSITELLTFSNMLICKIPNDIEVQFYLNTRFESSSVAGLQDRQEIVSDLPMYYRCDYVQTAAGKFIAIEPLTGSEGPSILGMKTLGGEFEYLAITKSEIEEVINTLHSIEGGFLQSADGYVLQDSEGTYLQSTKS